MAGSEGYGMVVSASDMMKALPGKDVFSSLYGDVSLQTQRAENQALYDYSKELNSAYATSLYQQQDIMSSNLGQGYKQQYMADTESALQQAYDTYLKKYQKSLSGIEEDSAKAVSDIYAAEYQRGQTGASLLSGKTSIYNFLSEMFNKSDTRFDQKFYENMIDKSTGKLKSWNDIASAIVDPMTGTLTDKGSNWLKTILFDQSLGDTSESYWSWLANQDPELYKQLTQGIDPYSGMSSMLTYLEPLGITDVTPTSTWDIPEDTEKGIAGIRSIKSELMKSVDEGGYGVTKSDYNKGISNNSAKVTSFVGSKGKHFRDQGTGKGEQDKYVQTIIDMAKSGKLKNGDVVNMDYGKQQSGNGNYVYYDGVWYKTDKKADINSENYLEKFAMIQEIVNKAKADEIARISYWGY